MKHIGIIGGIGPESTIAYYRLIIQKYNKKLQTKNNPEFLILNVNMTEMLDYVFKNEFENLVDFLTKRLQIFENSGVEIAVLASNTPHIVFDRLQEKTSITLISIVEETCKVVQQKKLKKVGLFGTKSTMSHGFYQKKAAKYGIEIVIPEAIQLDYIHEKYMNELVYKTIKTDTRQGLIEIALQLQEKYSIQGLILGGTELPLILSQSDFNSLEVFDTTQIHVDSIVSKMMEE